LQDVNLSHLFCHVLLDLVLGDVEAVGRHDERHRDLAAGVILHPASEQVAGETLFRTRAVRERVGRFFPAGSPASRDVVATYGTTAASAMPGCAMSMASSSAGATWNPLYLMSSLSRSTMKISSSSSTYPMSPVCSHPSASMVFAVASGLFRYPARTKTGTVCRLQVLAWTLVTKTCSAIGKSCTHLSLSACP
jgi:hypothetical protein